MYTNFESENDAPFVYSKPQYQRQFMDKTLQTVGLQLAVTAFIVVAARTSAAVGFVSEALGFLWLVGFVGIMLTLSCVRSIAQKAPTNQILLGLLTVCQAFLVHNSTKYINSSVLSEAVIITAVLLAVAYVFAQQADFDFTSAKFLVYFNLAHLAVLIVSWIFFQTTSVFWAYLGALAALVYIVVDLHMIMGNKSHKLTLDDHVLASMMLYLDIIQLVMKVIAILDDKKSKEKNRKN